MGIVIPVPDGVVFVADGRQVSLSHEGEPVISEEMRKIHQIAPSVAIITFGISNVTGHFLDTLRQNFDIPNVHIGHSPEEICSQIDTLLRRIWSHLTFPPETNMEDPSIAAGFAIGGLALGVPFVGITLQTPHKSLAFQVSSDPRARIIIGGNGHPNPHELYMTNEAQELALRNGIPGNMEPTVYALIRAAAKTMREVGRHDRSVGGTIQYSFFTGAPHINPMISGTYSD